jgi:hypothetical protein
MYAPAPIPHAHMCPLLFTVLAPAPCQPTPHSPFILYTYTCSTHCHPPTCIHSTCLPPTPIPCTCACHLHPFHIPATCTHSAPPTCAIPTPTPIPLTRHLHPFYSACLHPHLFNSAACTHTPFILHAYTYLNIAKHLPDYNTLLLLAPPQMWGCPTAGGAPYEIRYL